MSSSANGSHASDLSETLERPIFNRTLGKEVGTGVLDYEVYLKTRDLYALQTRRDELTVPEEHLFQVVHQAQELWLKAIAFEVVSFVDALATGRVHEACGLLRRIVVIQRCLASEMRVLQTLTPDVFQAIRRNLGNGSGLESPGYNRVLVAADAAATAFDALLVRGGVEVADLYRGDANDEARDGMLHVAELLLDWDEAFQTWLVTHFHLVRRTIGVHRKVLALDGFPTQALAPRMTKPLFPKLWDLRVDLTQGWAREGGHVVGAERGRGPKCTERPVSVVNRGAVPEP